MRAEHKIVCRFSDASSINPALQKMGGVRPCKVTAMRNMHNQFTDKKTVSYYIDDQLFIFVKKMLNTMFPASQIRVYGPSL